MGKPGPPAVGHLRNVPIKGGRRSSTSQVLRPGAGDQEGSGEGLPERSQSAACALSANSVITGGATMMGAADTPVPTALPSFDYWITEAIRLLEAEVPDYAGAVFCAGKATAAARSDIEWACGRH